MDLSKLKKLLLHALILLLLYFLQTDVFPHLKLFGMCPTPLPLAAVAFGLFEGGLAGGLWGLAAGVLCDVSLGATPAFTLYLTLAGFFTGFLAEFVMARGFPSFLLLSLLALVISVLLQSLPLVLSAHMSAAALARSGLVHILYTFLFALPIYWAARALGR